LIFGKQACPSCGLSHPQGAIFCQRCGTRIQGQGKIILPPPKPPISTPVTPSPGQTSQSGIKVQITPPIIAKSIGVAIVVTLASSCLSLFALPILLVTFLWLGFHPSSNSLDPQRRTWLLGGVSAATVLEIAGYAWHFLGTAGALCSITALGLFVYFATKGPKASGSTSLEWVPLGLITVPAACLIVVLSVACISVGVNEFIRFNHSETASTANSSSTASFPNSPAPSAEPLPSTSAPYPSATQPSSNYDPLFGLYIISGIIAASGLLGWFIFAYQNSAKTSRLRKGVNGVGEAVLGIGGLLLIIFLGGFAWQAMNDHIIQPVLRNSAKSDTGTNKAPQDDQRILSQPPQPQTDSYEQTRSYEQEQEKNREAAKENAQMIAETNCIAAGGNWIAGYCDMSFKH